MAQVCDLVRENFKSEQNYQDAISLFLPHEEDLCVTINQLPYAVAREFTSEQDRSESMTEYLEYIRNKYVWLLSPRCQAIDLMLQRCRLDITPRQASFIPYLIGPRGEMGFKTESPKQLRLEWDYRLLTERYRFACNLRLVGLDDVVTFIMMFVRRTLTPPEYWHDEGGSMNSLYYIQYFVARGDQISTRNIYVDGAWDMATMATDPFYVGFGDTFGMKSVGNTGELFPLQVWCRDDSQDVSVKLQVVQEVNAQHILSIDSFTFPMLKIVTGQVRTKDFAANISEGLGFLSRVYVPTGKIPQNIVTRAVYNLKHVREPQVRTMPVSWCVGQIPGVGEFRTALQNPHSNGQNKVTLRWVYLDGKQARIPATLEITQEAISPRTGTRYPVAWRLNLPNNQQYLVTPLSMSYNFDAYGIEFFNAGAIFQDPRTQEQFLGFLGSQNFIQEEKTVKRMLMQLNFNNVDSLVPYFMLGRTPPGTFVASVLFFVLIIVCIIFLFYLIKCLTKS
uniref:Uncharacterized protein n=1 Tax=viral metagenome TaxID=1070528 RepID=A0A6C0BMY6_9ZZZZ